MNYRALGNTGIKVSEIGFGAWGIGGASKDTLSYGPTNDAQSKKALRHAFDQGINFFDTADLYGKGHSEELIGSVFGKIRKHIVIASKVGYITGDGKQDFSRKHIEKAIHNSLRRLRTDYLDLYQLHDPGLDRLRKNPDLLSLFKKFLKRGLIRAFGVSLRSPDEGLDIIKRWDFPVLQVNFNMIDQRAKENGLLAICEKKNIGVICRTPLCFGFLTGKYPTRRNLHPRDHRRRWNETQIALWTNAQELFRKALLKKPRQTGAQLSLRFCLSYPAISTAIPGMLTSAHVAENVRASRLGPLSHRERSNCEKIYTQHTFFLSPQSNNSGRNTIRGQE